jgi:hypothetical protein
MIAYGFFLPAEDAIKIRAKTLGIPITEYLETKVYDFNVEEGDEEEFEENPIKYWDEAEGKGPTFEEFEEPIESRIGYDRYNRPTVFIGKIQAFDPSSISRLYDIMDEIDKEETKNLAEELGFVGYKFRYYIMGEDMHFNELYKGDIQKLRAKKL